MIDLLIKFPTRSRKDLFKKRVDQCVDLLSNKINVKFIFTFDENDSSMNNDEIRSFLTSKNVNMDYYYGFSENKIHACNRDIPIFDWNILLLMSDDMEPKQKNFDLIIHNDMKKYFPDYDGCLNYNAHTQAFLNNTMVLTVMGKKYYERFNYVYFPGYKSVFCDNEQTEVANKLGKLKNIDNRIIYHDWHGVKDDLRVKTECKDTRNFDKILFETRKANGFYI